MSNKNRKISNFILTPKFQLKLTFYYIGTGVAIMLATGGAVYFKFMQVRMILNDAIITDYSAQSQVNALMFHIAQISMVGFVLFAITSFIFALMVSHRIAGPVVAITTYIAELKKGNFNYGRKLRPNDELTLIMDALHDLSSALKDRSDNNQAN
jgi:signal transduction histidine kinase